VSNRNVAAAAFAWAVARFLVVAFVVSAAYSVIAVGAFGAPPLGFWAVALGLVAAVWVVGLLAAAAAVGGDAGRRSVEVERSAEGRT
jgi:hypothetical protein